MSEPSADPLKDQNMTIQGLPQTYGTKIDIDKIQQDGRIREDYGDIKQLADSIREHGLIQKIVLRYTKEPEGVWLLVGGRRLKALQSLGITILLHFEHFLWSEELDDFRAAGIELEENLRRKNLSWSEEVLAKKKLLEHYERLYGVARSGPAKIVGGNPVGFGVNKLAAMLGESNFKTSQDLELASLITVIPQLAKAETKEAARRTAQLGAAVAGHMQREAAKPASTIKERTWTLYEGDFVSNTNSLLPASCDFVLCDPPYGENTSGMGPNSKTLLADAFSDSKDTIDGLFKLLASASYRALRDDSFAAIFFGFTYYRELVDAFSSAGFDVDPSPVIWIKNTVINTSPYTRYGRSYEPILICRKGKPKMCRPAQRDVIQVDTLTANSGAKLYHAEKPLLLLTRLLDDMCVPGGTVVDFCAGSGSLGESAIRSKRKAILFEKDTTAIALIKARLGALDARMP